MKRVLGWVLTLGLAAVLFGVETMPAHAEDRWSVSITFGSGGFYQGHAYYGRHRRYHRVRYYPVDYAPVVYRHPVRYYRVRYEDPADYYHRSSYDRPCR